MPTDPATSLTSPSWPPLFYLFFILILLIFAKRLSEGEKTAITFLYFVVGLQDQDFDLAEGIVVIDDPISSLDSSSVYQAFSFLKNAVKDARQIFLLTHNFDPNAITPVHP